MSRRFLSPLHAIILAAYAVLTAVSLPLSAAAADASETSAIALPGDGNGSAAVVATADWVPFTGSAQLWCSMGNPSPGGFCNSYHPFPALDIGMPVGTQIRAAGPGTVTEINNTCNEGDSGCSGGRGRFVSIEHADGRTSRYLHMSLVQVTVNQVVERGQLLGLSGFTGSTTAPHLHYDEQDSAGTAIDPGPMYGLVGSSIVQYPEAFGQTSWWATSYGSVIRNDGTQRPLGVGDFTGDDKTDRAVYDMASGAWHVQGQADVTLGGAGQVPVPGDYDGNGRADPAVYVSATGVWHIQGQADQALGGPGLVPVPGDYNGDGRTDPAVYDRTNGIWHISGKADQILGGPGQVPVPADYNGDGATEPAVFDTATGTWHVQGQADVVFGGPAQLPVPADFTGDGKADLATYSPADGIWHVQGQADVALGGPGQIPVPGDFDGDHKLDRAAHDPGTGIWKVEGQADVTLGGAHQVPVSSSTPWITFANATESALSADSSGDGRGDASVYRASTGQWLQPGLPPVTFGLNGDVPLIGDLDGDGTADRTVYRPGNGFWFTQTQGWFPFQLTTPQPGDSPFLTDTDGDRRAEPMLYRPSTGELFRLNQAPVVIGQAGDVPVAADLDGDRRAELGVFRPSTGQWLFAGRAPYTFGQAGDVPVVGDFNGDGRDDTAVFRPSVGIWFFPISGWFPVGFGQNGDVPLVSDFDGDARTDVGVFRPSTGEFLWMGHATVALGQFGDIPVPRSAGAGPLLPGSPTGVGAVAGNATATVSWSQPAVNGGTTIYAYVATASPGGATVTVGATATQATFSGLTNGQPYTFTVQAVNIAGSGPASNPTNPVVPSGASGLPGTPAGVTAFAGFQQATVTWVAPTETGGSAITSYLVVAGPGGASTTVAGSVSSAVVGGLTNGQAYTFTVTAVNAAGSGTPSNPSNVVTPPGSGGGFHSLTPARVLDTRSGIGGPTASSMLGPGEVRNVTLTGAGGVPAKGVGAVVLNVTVTGPTAASHLTVWPAGQQRPLASNLNFVAGETVPNMVLARIGVNGQVSVYNNAGSTHVIFDVVGWFDTDGSGDRYTGVTPARILDTRTGTGSTATKLGPGQTRDVTVAGVGGVPAAGATTVVMNVTVTGPTASSHLTVWTAGLTMPTASNLNFVAGQTVPNLVVAKVGANGKVSVYNNAGSTDVIFDVVGFYSVGGSMFTGLTPARILDTRYGIGGPTAKFGAGETRSLTVSAVGGVPPAAVTAVAVNVTVTSPTAPSHLIVWPSGQEVPTASSLNFVAGETVPNLVIVRVGPDGKINLFNKLGSADVIVDVVGYYS